MQLLIIGAIVLLVYAFIWWLLKDNKLLRDAFLMGNTFCLAFYGIIQDTLGREGYIELIKKYWVHSNTLTWILFIGVMFIVATGLWVICRKYRFEETTVKKIF